MAVLGSFRLAFLAVTIFMSGFLQGYDAGVVGGVLTFAPFESDFGYSTAQKTQVNALSVGLEQVGCFIACPLTYPIADRFGRRTAIIMSVSIFILGAILQTINTGNLGAWYFARIVAGLGQGGYTSVVPSFAAEMAPKELRGRIGSMYQWMYTWGEFSLRS